MQLADANVLILPRSGMMHRNQINRTDRSVRMSIDLLLMRRLFSSIATMKFMWLLVATTIWTALSSGAYGCHSSDHVAEQSMSAASPSSENTAEIQNYFSNCLTINAVDNSRAEAVDYVGVVQFFVEFSSWYEVATRTCSISTKNDTVECWTYQLEQVLEAGSLQLAAALTCVRKYYFFNTYEVDVPYENELANVKYENRTDDQGCPNRTASSYENCVSKYLENILGVSAIPIPNFNSVMSFVAENTKCSSCDCTDAVSKNKDFSENFSSKRLSCDSCWSTRLSGLVDGNSVLKEATAACAATVTDTDDVSSEQLSSSETQSRNF